MSDAVVVAIITALSTIICQLIINRNNRKKQSKEDAEKARVKAVQDAVKETELKNELAEINHKLDIHNGYAEKLGEIEKSMAVIKTEIKNLYHRRGEET